MLCVKYDFQVIVILNKSVMLFFIAGCSANQVKSFATS